MAVLAVTTAVGLAQPEADDPNAPQVDDGASQEASAAPIPDSPLEDYEASEQISEDLSVSFPIDI